ncbi:MAG: D-glycerate dehydrogenase [Bdellovibrionota bacterium]
MKPLLLISRSLPLPETSESWQALLKVAEPVIRSQRDTKPFSRHAQFKRARALIPLVSDVIDRSVLDLAPELKVVSNYGVGFNNIDLVECSKRGIAVCNTPDVLTNATAELTIGLIFAAARRFKEASEILRTQKFKAWDPKFLLGRELSSARLGIIGLGRIGLAVAQKAHALGMKVSACSNSTKPAPQFVELTSLEMLLKTSDFISVHCPLNSETQKLLGPKQFDQMKRGGYLINTSRGEIIDEKALLRALDKEMLRGAALDVFWNEPKLNPRLRAHPKVFVLPHIGSATAEARSGMAKLAVDAVAEILSGRRPKNQVN